MTRDLAPQYHPGKEIKFNGRTITLGEQGGGRGSNFRARDGKKEVFVKLPRTDEFRFPELLITEHETLEQLAGEKHPAILTAHEFGYVGADPCLTFDYISSTDGAALLKDKSTALQLKDSKSLVKRICDALSHIHSREIIHCDVKPGNILLPLDKLLEGSLLIDFGFSKNLRDCETRHYKAVLGSPYYVAPETWTDLEYNARTDLYALGSSLYHLLTNHPPCGEGLLGQQIGLCHVYDPIRPLPAHYLALAPFFDRALAKKPNERHKDAQEFKAHFLECVSRTTELEPTDRKRLII